MDTDTGWHRQLAERLPIGKVSFGDVCGVRNKYVQGGFIGMTLEAVTAANEHPVMDALSDPLSWCPAYLLHNWERKGIVCEDMVWGQICRSAGIEVLDYSDVRVGWRQKPNEDQRYAVTHPCKGTL
jgi:hypothetical protein